VLANNFSTRQLSSSAAFAVPMFHNFYDDRGHYKIFKDSRIAQKFPKNEEIHERKAYSYKAKLRVFIRFHHDSLGDEYSYRTDFSSTFH